MKLSAGGAIYRSRHDTARTTKWPGTDSEAHMKSASLTREIYASPRQSISKVARYEVMAEILMGAENFICRRNVVNESPPANAVSASLAYWAQLSDDEHKSVGRALLQ